MPKVEISVDHKLGKEEALRRIQSQSAEAGKQMAAQHGAEYTLTWNNYVGSFSVKAQGQSISGKVVVEDRRVTLHASVPFMLLPFKGMVERLLREQAKQFLQ